ncbi:hypothetical protein PR048_000896 [Dryococelus australis]|uniref:Uncharacterized protein n=1 Tax=Dryococelus australis TaxID=614101 RepID=A0ABQ9IFU9_9NEOP|nr:hypothetical protein PR048_000896 [Dryococelus australis]
MASIVNIPTPLILTGNAAANWATFKPNFEIYIIASGNVDKPDIVKVALLLNIIDQYVIDVYNTFNLSTADKQSYKNVIQAFDDYTTPRRNVAYERTNKSIHHRPKLTGHVMRIWGTGRIPHSGNTKYNAEGIPSMTRRMHIRASNYTMPNIGGKQIPNYSCASE